MSSRTVTKRIVVEVDGTVEGLRTVDYACMEACRVGAELVFVRPYHAHAPYTPAMNGYAPRSPAEIADDDLRVAVAHARRQVGPSLQLVALSKEGPRTKVLVQAARAASLLIVGRSRARGPQRLVSAHLNLHLAARSQCPVVVVPGTWKPTAADRTVAVGVDGTVLSREALGYAFHAAVEREGDLIVLHAAQVRRTRMQEEPDESWVRTADRLIGEAIDTWSQHFPHVKVSRFITNRPVVAALVHEAQHAGLVVLGAHSGLLPLTDPVARQTLAAITCPVAIVPHRPTEAELEEARRRRREAAGELVVPTY